MDDKTKKAMVAIFAALVSLIASVLGCVFAIPTDSVNDAMGDIISSNSSIYYCTDADVVSAVMTERIVPKVC